MGFQVPVLSAETQEKLGGIFPHVNTSFRNPVDTGASGVLADLIIKTINALEADKNISNSLREMLLAAKKKSVAYTKKKLKERMDKIKEKKKK